MQLICQVCHFANIVEFSRLLTNFMQLELCRHTYDVTRESDRIAIMQSAVNLYRLLRVLDSQASDHHLRRVQGVAEHR